MPLVSRKPFIAHMPAISVGGDGAGVWSLARAFSAGDPNPRGAGKTRENQPRKPREYRSKTRLNSNGNGAEDLIRIPAGLPLLSRATARAETGLGQPRITSLNRAAASYPSALLSP